METISFKTNMKCSGCIDKVAPELNELVGKDQWNVNLQIPDKMLTVTSKNKQIKEIEAVVSRAGFLIERL